MSQAEQLMIFIDAAILVALCADLYYNYHIYRLMLANGGQHV